MYIDNYAMNGLIVLVEKSMCHKLCVWKLWKHQNILINFRAFLRTPSGVKHRPSTFQCC